MTDNDARSDFEGWLAVMDDAIDELMDGLPADVRARLDYSSGSLDVLEAWLLRAYPSYEALTDDAAAETLDGAARYVGETFRRELGGRWDIELDNAQDVNFLVPALTGFKGGDAALSPITLVSAAADRRTGTYLRTVLENMRRRAHNTPV